MNINIDDDVDINIAMERLVDTPYWDYIPQVEDFVVDNLYWNLRNIFTETLGGMLIEVSEQL